MRGCSADVLEQGGVCLPARIKKELMLPAGPLKPPSDTCSFPGCVRPIFFDAEIGRVHDFCSVLHAQEAESVCERLLSNESV